MIALAPSKTKVEWINPDFPMAPGIDSLLVLQGTHDGDQPAGAGSLLPYEAARPLSLKHFCWIHGANHIQLLDTIVGLQDPFVDFTPDNSTAIHFDTHHAIVLNYIAAFIRWRISKNASFRSVFIGDGGFDFTQSMSGKVQEDLNSGRLRVFSRYDHGTLPQASQ